MRTAAPFLHQNMEEYVNIPDLLFIIRLTDNKRHHKIFFTSVERMFVPQVALLKGLSRPSENRILKKAFNFQNLMGFLLKLIDICKK